MGNKLYVGNLAFTTSETELEGLFSPHGEVISARIIMDRDSGRSKGFGFVEMQTPEMAKAAIESLDGQEAFGRNLRVSEAQERAPRSPRGGGDRRY